MILSHASNQSNQQYLEIILQQSIISRCLSKLATQTLLYLFLLIIIYASFLSYNHEHSFFKIFNLTVNKIATQIPTGEISKGTMKIQEQSPYTITLPSEKTLDNKKSPTHTLTPLAVFDMTNQTTPANTPVTFIFHTNGYYFINVFLRTRRNQSQHLQIVWVYNRSRLLIERYQNEQ